MREVSAIRIGGTMDARPRYVAAVAVAAVLSLFAAGCTSSTGGGGGGGAQEGGVLRIGTSSGLTSLNPFVGFNQDDYSAWMYIYPSLLQYDTTTPTYDYMPEFATEWEQSADGLTVTFQTVADATWSDGEPLTADDVAWTINMIKQYANGPTGSVGRECHVPEDDRGDRPQHARRDVQAAVRYRAVRPGLDADPAAASVGAVRDG